MKTVRAQTGFTLIAAIFLLVVVASLVVYMTNIRVVQQTTVVYGLQGARAIMAARSGLEWGISRAIVGGSCAASTSFTDPALAGFNVEVQCSQTTHTEGTAIVPIYRLSAIASSGGYGSLDYVQRRLRVTVSVDPP
jgi:MSHA biogenesis protein MshP